MSAYYQRKAKRHKPVAGEPIHPEFAEFVEKLKQRMLSTDDNCTVVCFGPTGSGKSTLAFHVGDVYNDGEGVDTDLVAFDPESLADALKVADKGDFLMIDEANISKRDAMTKYNKDVIDLMYAVRSRNWFTWLNNPSADYLDKELVQGDLVNFFIFIYAKQARFLLFSKKGMQKFYRHNQTLRNEEVRKWGRQYAILDSYFCKYSGPDWDEYYNVKKEARIDDKIAKFIEQHGKQNKKYTTGEAADILGVDRTTVYRWLKKVEDEDFLDGARNARNEWRLDADRVDYLRDFMQAEGDLSEPFSATDATGAVHTHITRKGDSSLES